MKPIWRIVLPVVVVIAVATAIFLSGSKPEPIRYPSPNGYDNFMAATEALVHLPGKPEDPTLLTAEERAWLIQSNNVALARLRDGLGKDSWVVISGDPTSPKPMQYLMGLKKLSQLLEAEAAIARATSNHTALLSACIDNYELGSRGTQGGRFIEGLVGFAVHSIALRSMVQIENSEDAALCRKAAMRLFQAVTNAPTAADYQREEDRWVATLPFTARWHPETIRSWFTGEKKKTRLNFLSRFDRVRALESDTLRNLAAAAFRLEHGRAATNWTELVPEYLPEIPRNATNNAPLALVGP